MWQLFCSVKQLQSRVMMLCYKVYVCLVITLTRSPKAELRRAQLNGICICI